MKKIKLRSDFDLAGLYLDIIPQVDEIITDELWMRINSFSLEIKAGIKDICEK